MRCVRHPQSETFVQCAKCDAPICTDCMVTGPVGIRCPSCAKPSSTPLFQPKPVGMLRAGAGGLGVAVLLGWVVKIQMLLGGAALGVGIGEIVVRLGGHKRGRMMEGIAGGCALLAVLLWGVPWVHVFTWNLIALLPWVFSPFGLLMTLAGAALAVVCAVSRIRYL